MEAADLDLHDARVRAPGGLLNVLLIRAWVQEVRWSGTARLLTPLRR